MYFIYITITNENWLEEKVNIVQCQKLDFLALSSLSSTSTGLSPKSFEKRAHNKNCVGHKIFIVFGSDITVFRYSRRCLMIYSVERR